ncbi:Glycosyl phosphatidyl inositol protein transamidase complex subunit [Dispira parvispora]|uniref:Glycosyl phosphatidyl inositol protein transamidase complex subunit n=1 Tax=Dispira parvispora TaxID=1520584 RepID=A0A9W8B136_9FUNG|nr:Glycosyl phosphatidyl inositol protein transamidase complex subunit [Dispira parvispora]
MDNKYLKRLRRTEKIQTVLAKVQQHISLLSYILLVVAFLWLLTFPSIYYSKKTYISENALLPNQAILQYETHQAQSAYQHMHALQAHQSSEQALRYVQRVLEETGLRTETQSFNYTDPLSGRLRTGNNLHGIMYAPQGDTTEALVLAAEWSSGDGLLDDIHQQHEEGGIRRNINGVAQLLSLAQHFRTLNHWSKDLIFLVVEQGQIGAEMWLRGYHGNDYPYAAPIRLRSGAIQGALALDLPAGESYSGLGAFFAGKNGQLPNLDLLNILARITQKLDVPWTLQHITRRTAPLLSAHRQDISDTGNWGMLWQHYCDATRTLVGTMSAQASGITVGIHGPFHRFRIDAVTLQAQVATAEDPISMRFHFAEVGKVVESTFHSLSNLLEHFHQSFFFYLLPSPWQYISIADFSPPILIMAAALLCSALASWWAATEEDSTDASSSTEDSKHEDSVLFDRAEKQFTRRITTYLAFWSKFPQVQRLLWTCYGGLGTVLYLLPWALANWCGTMTDSCTLQDNASWWLWGSVSIVVGGLAVLGSQCPPQCDTRLLRTCVLLIVMLATTAVSVMNFSLALVLALLLCPPMVFLPTGHSASTISSATVGGCQLRRMVLTVWLMIISPPMLVYFMHRFTALPLPQLLGRILVEYDLFGAWIYPLIGFVYWPTLVLALIILWR